MEARQENSSMSKLLSIALGFEMLAAHCGAAAEPGALPTQGLRSVRTFRAQGIVREVAADRRAVVIAHEAIPNYMDAMIMPFKVKEPRELDGLRPGDKVLFRLEVADTESWIDGISKSGSGQGQPAKTVDARASEVGTPKPRHPLLDYPFTNELAQAVRLSDFRGQALAVTFFFTRCPIPDYCPRLSKNFEEASQKLAAMTGGPTNWHFLSVTFDPETDTPSVLKAYGERYHYDPKRWSFLTGPKKEISELASESDVKTEPASGFINHNFRTLIIDASGHLQMIFPMGGNLSDDIVAEVVKAAAVPGRPLEPSDREAQAQTAAIVR